MKRSDFSYQLPPELIAQQPPAERGMSRLLRLHRDTGAISHNHFTDLPQLLRPGDLLVFNDTRVIPARLYGCKPTGGRVELLVERVTGAYTALVHLRASKTPAAGSYVLLCPQRDAPPGPHRLTIAGREGALFAVSSSGGAPIAEILAAIGHMPIPPYIDRADSDVDRERYQTVYARHDGAVAAPTAGLHFSDAMLQQLEERGIRRAAITLHVGAGTFQPVREEEIELHQMHAEYARIGAEVCAAITEARAAGGRVVAVGTTAVRALESASLSTCGPQPASGDTAIFIYPGYRFRTVDAIITNFHLPESTLLMLVSAFAGRENTLAAYAEAIAQRYRFYSYGDAMLIDNEAGSQAPP